MAPGLPTSPSASGAPSFLTVAEVAAMLRVSKMTVYRMVHSCLRCRSGAPSASPSAPFTTTWPRDWVTGATTRQRHQGPRSRYTQAVTCVVGR